jgi:glutaredoxin
MKGADYEVVNLDQNPEKQAEAYAISGALTVPITTDGDSVVIGWNAANLTSLLDKSKLVVA